MIYIYSHIIVFIVHERKFLAALLGLLVNVQLDDPIKEIDSLFHM